MLTTHHGRVTRDRHCHFALVACVVQETPSEPVSPCVCQCGVSESTCQFYSNLCPCFKWPAYCLSCGCPREIDECSVFFVFSYSTSWRGVEGESLEKEMTKKGPNLPLLLPHPHTHCPQFSSLPSHCSRSLNWCTTEMKQMTNYCHEFSCSSPKWLRT